MISFVCLLTFWWIFVLKKKTVSCAQFTCSILSKFPIRIKNLLSIQWCEKKLAANTNSALISRFLYQQKFQVTSRYNFNCNENALQTKIKISIYDFTCTNVHMYLKINNAIKMMDRDIFTMIILLKESQGYFMFIDRLFVSKEWSLKKRRHTHASGYHLFWTDLSEMFDGVFL